MLNTIREKLSGTFAVIILGLIALSLVVTFGNIDTGFTRMDTAAKVNGEEIPTQEFRSTFQRQRQQWESNFGVSIPNEIATSLAANVLDSIVRNRVVSMHAQDQGYRVNDVDVIAAIQGSTVFQVGGRFSQPAYEALLRSEGLSPQRFEFEQRQSMQVGQYIEGIGYTAFFTPAEFRRYVELDAESRGVDYALLAVATKREEVSVSDDDVKAWYEANPALYQTDETVALEYIELDFGDVLAGVAVDEEQARAYFEANPGEFGGVEERLTSHILLSGQQPAELLALAESLYERLEGGEQFEVLAAEFSTDRGSAASGGRLGWLGSGDTPARAFEDALFRLRPGEVSEPVETEFGVHLIRLEGVRDGASPAFEQISFELQERLREQQAADRFNELLEELDERALESIGGLAAVASDMGLPLKQIDYFSRNDGGMPIARSPQLVDVVFSLEVLEDGENSPILSLDNDRAVVLRVTDHRLPTLRPLEEVADAIRLELEAEQAAARVRDTGSRIIAELNSGRQATQVLASEGLTLQNLQDVRRADDRLAPDLLSAIFRAPVSRAEGGYQSLLLANGDFAVFRVVSVTPGSPDLFLQEDRDARKEQLAGRLGGNQVAAAVEMLVNAASVTIAPNLIESELGLQ